MREALDVVYGLLDEAGFFFLFLSRTSLNLLRCEESRRDAERVGRLLLSTRYLLNED